MAGKSSKLKWKKSGFRRILTSSATKGLVLRHARAIAKEAGEGFEATVYAGKYGGGRAIGVVRATTDEARAAEATDKALSKAVNTAR